ncbi:putative necrosis-inducing factor-domain-containing protein [Colletotrichum navitas]|uniref:Necrosis-inducing factor-domain-containing protein n=1 Tax=Colletotrichum navitas TaxID=681940 RepID=A0AAD8PT17_9PEZI|nr:putative necrosis-inducing factor-domain-containing protein [Colletotrichum navitas]KAK1580218.1 putative necrosis-inducing factor-domain-containing protein [Colletotrichum navitas]
MVKVRASLVSAIVALAHVSSVTPFCVPPFPNNTNGTNTTVQTSQSPGPFPTTALGRPPATYDVPGRLPGPPALASLSSAHELESEGPSFYRGSQRWHKQICGMSSFAGFTSATSALTADCLALADDAAEAGHLWYAKGFADNTTVLELRNHGTCSFGIRPPYADDMYGIVSGWYVGGVDVAEVVRTAVRDYDAGGLVGATGVMHCTISSAANVDVQWAIFGPGEQAEAGWWMAPPVPSSAGTKASVGRAVFSAVAAFWLPVLWYVVS